MATHNHLTLTEAISLIAWNKRFSAERLSHELRCGHFKSKRPAIELVIALAARQFSSAGLRGEISCTGRTPIGTENSGAFNPLGSIDYLNYPHFLYTEDALLFRGERHEENLTEYELGFIMHSENAYFRDVRVEPVTFAKAFKLKLPPPMVSIRVKPFTPNQRREWIANQPRTKADIGWNSYKSMDKRCGITRGEFRKLWADVHGTKRGRPLGKKSKPAL